MSEAKAVRRKAGTGHVRERRLRDGSKRFDVLAWAGGKQYTVKGSLRSYEEAARYLLPAKASQKPLGKAAAARLAKAALALPRVPSDHYLYSIWHKMIARCCDSSDPGYRNYGGRGIRVHPEWIGALGLRLFAAHVGERPTPKHSLGRIDNNGHYEPGNVRWETWKEQHNNRRGNVLITRDGQTLTISQWADATGLASSCISQRLKAGWAPEVAVSAPRNANKDAAHAAAGVPPARTSTIRGEVQAWSARAMQAEAELAALRDDLRDAAEEMLAANRILCAPAPEHHEPYEAMVAFARRIRALLLEPANRPGQ